MSSPSVADISTYRDAIKKRWEILLREMPVSSPLAAPDTLVYMMDKTLDDVFKRSALSRRNLPNLAAPSLSEWFTRQCPCGLNPLLAYFLAGEVALAETLESLSAILGKPLKLDLGRVLEVYRLHAQNEVRILCEVCRSANRTESCRRKASFWSYRGARTAEYLSTG